MEEIPLEEEIELTPVREELARSLPVWYESASDAYRPFCSAEDEPSGIETELSQSQSSDDST